MALIRSPFPPNPEAPPFYLQGNDWVPVGAVIAFAGGINLSPQDGETNIEAWGWMLCDGRKLEIGEYPELFKAIGYLYGKEKVDDKSYFRLPDYRGYFLRGLATNNEIDKGFDERNINPGKGSTGTRNGLGSSQDNMVQMHEHQYENYPGGGAAPGETGTVNPSTPKKPYTTGLFKDSSGSPPLSGTETRPVNIYINYIIKFASMPTWAVWLQAAADMDS